ncbi:MAG: FKBP-type peptidyl-prolyl cis-trans isomerase, partial [Planctomycetales bacterium]|nr:FKBP-type peptidyl-prolyl cis-trans isomerase [Planctomycetales bacterium]
MTRSIAAAFVAALLLTSHAFAQTAAEAPKTFLEKVSYAIGLGLGRNLGQDNVQPDLRWLAKGVQDGNSAEGKPLMTEAEVQETMQAFDEFIVKQQKSAGEAYLAANSKKQGVVTTASGLQYEILKRGTGAQPKATDTVKVHYHGTLTDGAVFDSSVQRGQPTEFPVNRVIAGWT